MELPIKSFKGTSEAKEKMSGPGAVTDSKAGAVTDSEAGAVTGIRKMFLTYPSSLAIFSSFLLENVELKDVMNPVVKGYVLKRKFFYHQIYVI